MGRVEGLKKEESIDRLPALTKEDWERLLHLEPGDKVRYRLKSDEDGRTIREYSCTVVSTHNGWALLEKNGRRFGAMLTDIRRKEWGRKV
nr:MAG TPA: Protein of unknown function (DUF1344) [Caudoviricetes sp.]